jgi:N-acetylated-alpha-linked acidic dipeptidase
MAVEAGMSFDAAGLRDEVAAATEACRAANSRISDIRAAGEVERVREVSKQLLAFERNWLDERGLTGRAWFANTFAASDRDSGYGAVVLPLVAEAIRDRDQTALDQAIQRYRMTIGRIRTAASGLARPGA